MALGFTACSGKPLANGDNGVDMKGGFVAETNGYVYFINGVESYSTTYKTGKVTKGALMRVAKSKFAGATETDYETVVSKLIVSDDKTAGFYISGDYVYYAVPSDENNKKGETKSDQLLFFRTKLDASETSNKIADKDFSHDATFRFIASGSNVYLAVYSTNLYVYDAVKGTEVMSTEDVAYDAKNPSVARRGSVKEVMFDEDNAAPCVYYTYNPIDTNQWQDRDNATAENYYDVYRVDLADGKATDNRILTGVGKVKDDKSEEDLIGLTFDLLRHKDGKLYYSQTSLNTSVGSVKYFALKDGESKGELLTYATTKTTAAFADSVLFYSENGSLVTLYVDASLGLVKFDYTKSHDANYESDYGVYSVSDEEALKKATLKFINKEGSDDYLYYVDSNSNYYKVNISALLKGEKPEALRINTLSLNTSWYTPEVVEIGGKFYFFCVYSDSDYKSYVYAIDMNAVEEGVKAVKAEKGDDFAETDYYSYDKKKEGDAVKLGQKLGVYSEADKPKDSTTSK